MVVPTVISTLRGLVRAIINPLLRMLDHCIRWMRRLIESAAESATDTLFASLTASFAQIESPARAMMAVDTLNVTILAIDTRIETCEEGYSFNILLRCFIFVLEWTFVHFGAGSAEVMVIAELIVASTFFDLFEHRRRNHQLLVETAWSWIPFHLRMRRDDC